MKGIPRKKGMLHGRRMLYKIQSGLIVDVYKREKKNVPLYIHKWSCNQRPYGVAKNITFKMRRPAISCGFAYAGSLILDKTFNLFGYHILVLDTLLKFSLFVFVDLMGLNWLFWLQILINTNCCGTDGGSFICKASGCLSDELSKQMYSKYPNSLNLYPSQYTNFSATGPFPKEH